MANVYGDAKTLGNCHRYLMDHVSAFRGHPADNARTAVFAMLDFELIALEPKYFEQVHVYTEGITPSLGSPAGGGDSNL